MSRTVRKQLMEISDTLQKANELLAGLLEGVPTEEMISLLTDCQNCAITMGNKIEAVYGLGTTSVKALEEYCESIFRMSQTLGSRSKCMEAYETAKEQLIAVRENMEREIPDKQEIVFMPYKASMWDALESVYLAAREDESCDAYVVPIPYFDRKADKTLGQMHYEGTEYPKNIEITDWEEYRFEERLPDVIYIHNAYDDMNLVTCVHPRFFSSNLKKYTEKLIYIPYFVLEEIDPKDQAKIDGIKHFCVLPGIINADKVIVQSENMRQIYINEYTKAIEAAGGSVDRKRLEEKFLGLGSPKFDKVLNTRKEDLEIPEEWLKTIQKADGSWKKIIFYNTSVAALLQHDEKMLEKMKSVFSIFKEHQDEVALLWRPHPLIKTTIESMRPQLWAEYSKLVEQYKEEGWGIYDDTADMDRAVVLCDGYYGDPSSVVQLVQKTGKPVMVQNVMTTDIEGFENAYLISRGADFDDESNILWMVTNFTSILLKIDIEKRVLLDYYRIPVCEITDYDFIEIKKVGDFLFIAPYNADNLFCFSVKEENFTQIKLPLSDAEILMEGKFRQIFHIKDSIYFIGWNLKLIIKLGLLDLEMKRIEGFASDSDTLARDGVVIGDDLYIPFSEENAILHIKTIDDSWEKIAIDNGCSKGYETITQTAQGFIMTDVNDNKISYDINDGKIQFQELQIMSKFQTQYQEFPYSQQYQKVFLYQGKEYYFPICEGTVYEVSKWGDKKEIAYRYPYDARFKFHYSKYEMIQKHKNKIYFQTRTNGDIYELNLDTDRIQRYILQVPLEQKEALINTAIKYKYQNIVSETDIYELKSFIVYIKGDKCEYDEKQENKSR